jgi:glutaminase
MHPHLHSPSSSERGVASTGSLPAPQIVQAVLKEAYERYRDVDDGEVAQYIPALARTPRDLFALCVATTEGERWSAGARERKFTIQSVAKPFVFALVCQTLGGGEARRRIGVNSTGLSFDSVMAIELHPERTVNPMVNPGAIATTSLVPGETAEARWEFVRGGLSQFAGRRLAVNEEVYRSETGNNERNLGIARLLASYGRMYAEAALATDLYTRQCSLHVSVEDLATMAATLAAGGINPRTSARVIDEERCSRVLAVLATAGMYESSGDWLYEVGLPAKSGVSGGIICVVPGKAGIAAFSPPLDDSGTSVRGQLAIRFLSERLGLNLFASHFTGLTGE